MFMPTANFSDSAWPVRMVQPGRGLYGPSDSVYAVWCETKETYRFDPMSSLSVYHYPINLQKKAKQ